MFSSQQQQQDQSNSSKHICVITNVDSLFGYALAFRFLQAMQESNEDPADTFHKKLRILCRHREGMDLKRLEKMGAEICQVDYKDEDKVCEAMKNVRNVLLIPENSRDRLKEAQCLMKAAKRQGVEHMGLMSYVGVDKIPNSSNDDPSAAGKFRNMMEYQKIEQLVKEEFQGSKHCIVRHQIFNQMYYFLAPQIEGENMLCLPVKKDAKWGSLNMIECVEGVFQLCKKQHQQSRGEQVDPFFTGKQLWEFTLHRSMKTEEMAKQIGEGLGREQMKYEEMSPKDFRSHLERMKQDKRFQERPDSEGKLHEGRDGWWSVPIGKFLNEENIETTVEYLQLACNGRVEHSSEDLRKLLGRNPQELKQYFKVNRDMFKRFK